MTQINQRTEKKSLSPLDWMLVQDAVTGILQKTKVSAIAGNSAPLINVIQLQHSLPSGTVGDSAITNSWTARKVNLIVKDDTNSATLTDNIFTLPAGKYSIDCDAFFYLTDVTKLRLRNLSDDVDILYSTSIYARNSIPVSCSTPIKGSFTIAANKNLQIQYYCSNANVQNGNLGVGTSVPNINEIFLNALFLKIG
jgi:hypothetical protein